MEISALLSVETFLMSILSISAFYEYDIMKRRTFIKNSACAFGAKVILPVVTGGSDQKGKEIDQVYPIIDTHQHLWDDRFNLTWPGPPISEGAFMIPEYRKEVEGLNIVKSLYMEVAVPKKLRREEAHFALGLCADKTNTTVGASICADPYDHHFRNFVSEFAANPYLKGVRGRFESVEVLLSDRVTNNLRWLGRQGLLFDLGTPFKWFKEVSLQIEKCPETTFVLNHCGLVDPVALFPDEIAKPREPRHSPEVWRSDLKLLAEKENVICKISGIVDAVRAFTLESRHLAPTVNYCLDTFGADRVVFASDWPVCLYNMSLKEWVHIVKEIVKDRPLPDQKKLFHNNAARIYKI